MRELRIGDRVRLLEHTGMGGKLGTVHTVVSIRGHSDTCPYGLDMGNSKDYAPFRERYELIANKNLIGGKLL